MNNTLGLSLAFELATSDKNARRQNVLFNTIKTPMILMENEWTHQNKKHPFEKSSSENSLGALKL